MPTSQSDSQVIEPVHVESMLKLSRWCLTRLTVDLAVLIELLNYDSTALTLDFTLVPSDFIRKQVLLFRYLFLDSKRLKGTACPDISAILTRLMFELDTFHAAIRQAEQVLSLSSSVNDTNRSESLVHITANLESSSKVVSESIMEILRISVDKVTNDNVGILKRLEFADSSREDTEFRLRTPEFADLRLFELIEDGDLTETVDSLSHFVHACIGKARLDIWNANAGKNKGKLSWNLRLGFGINEYALNLPHESAIDSLENVVADDEWLSQFLEVKNSYTSRPKPAKGCVDYQPHEMAVRGCIINEVERIFQKYGAVPIDTPIFELKEVLTGKYGEDSKLIYDLKDQGGEQLALRYDLTVPFARYCATNNVERIRRYHIGKVYRRDEPQMNRGRFREFYQCDFDIAGRCDALMGEAEILNCLRRCLTTLRPIIGEFCIKINHRGLLDGMLEYAGVPHDKTRGVSAAIDKLDKEPWDVVKHEMTAVKGVDLEVADKLESLVMHCGPISQVVKIVRENSALIAIESVKKAIEDIEAISQLVGDTHIQLCTGLARGLDYYTGLIFEASMVKNSINLGSIAAGGRYDGLIGMFAGKEIPAIGMSLGIERIFRLAQEKFEVTVSTLKNRETGKIVSLSPADVYVVTLGNLEVVSRIEVAEKLRSAGVRATYSHKRKVNLKNEISVALDMHVRYMVLVGEDELERGTYKLKDLVNSHEKTVDFKELINEVTKIDSMAALMRRELFHA